MNFEELLLKARPILFNTEMCLLILDGRKTVTRRIVRNQSLLVDNDCKHEDGFFDAGGNDWACKKRGCGIHWPGKSLYHAPYQVGDILYVRETWQRLDSHVLVNLSDNEYAYVYKASHNGTVWEQSSTDWTWKPSIHMPKEAARILLKVKEVKMERLQDIDNVGSVKEGATLNKYKNMRTNNVDVYRCEFAELWNSTVNKNDLEKSGWSANPFVWVIEFELLDVQS